MAVSNDRCQDSTVLDINIVRDAETGWHVYSGNYCEHADIYCFSQARISQSVA